MGSTAETGKPSPPDSPVVGETTLSVMLIDPFSDHNGPILGYTVLVSRDPNMDTSSLPRMPSWSEARDDSSIVAYQVFGIDMWYFLCIIAVVLP